MVLFQFADTIIRRGPMGRNRFWQATAFLLALTAFLLSVTCITPRPAHPQAWSGILDPSRATDWSGAGVQGGIPSYTNVCQTVNPSGDTSGSTDGADINSALSTCAASASASSPQVVLLAAGTFYSKIGIGPPLGASYLVLRGAGPDKTIIKFLGTSNQCGRSSGVDVCIAGNTNDTDQYSGGTTAWLGTNGSIGTYSQGVSALDVTSTTGLFVGQIINLTQRNDSMGLCPQSGGTGNCAGQVGLTHSGTTVTAVTSAPYSAISSGASVYVGTNNNNSLDGSCGGYQSGPTPWTVLSATTTSTNTTFTYTDSNTLTSPTSNCQPIFAAVDNGGLFTCNVNGGCTLSNAFAGAVCSTTQTNNQCQPGEISMRSENELHIIEAICAAAGSPVAACKASNEVIIDGQVIAPNYRSSQNPGIWWTGSSLSKYSQYDGLESFTVDATGETGAFASSYFLNAVNSWVRNIRSINTSSLHVGLEQAAHISVVDSYLYGTKSAASESYGTDTVNATNVLIENNIIQHIPSGIMTEQTYGDVFAYNYAFDAAYKPALGMLFAITDMNHGFAGANLFEGNDTDWCESDPVHGTSWGLTFFRNRCRGQDTPPMTSLLMGVADPTFQRAQNFVGNILGTTGAQNTYMQSAQIPSYPSQGVYWLNNSNGYIENGGGGYTPLNLDPVVASTLLRWGNYDVVTGAVRWCGDSSDPGWSAVCDGTSEIPTAGVAFINGNSVPSSTTLPPSFFLSSVPSFWTTTWGTPSWPAVGPDVTGGTAPDGVAGYSYSIPAQLCYANTAADPAYQQTLTVTGASWSSGTASLTISSNTLASGNTVTVSGVSPAGYNGVFQVTSATSSTVSYALPNSPGSYVSGGTVAYPNILLFNSANCYPNGYGGGAPAPPTNLSALVQ